MPFIAASGIYFNVPCKKKNVAMKNMQKQKCYLNWSRKKGSVELVKSLLMVIYSCRHLSQLSSIWEFILTFHARKKKRNEKYTKRKMFDRNC